MEKQKEFKGRSLKKSMATILFGRLIFDKKQQKLINKEEIINERKEFLLKIINFRKNINKLLKESEADRYIKKGKWCFAGIKGVENYIYGKLVKEKSCEKIKRDEKKEDYIPDKDTESKVAFFLIDLSKNIIAYESKKDVGEKAPITIIQNSFNSNFKEDISLEINIIKDKRKIIERMKKFSVIDYIEMSISPTNPNSTDNSDKMDNFLNTENMRKLKLQAYFKDDGFNPTKEGLIKSGFALAQEGYGSASAKGKYEPKEKIGGEKPKKVDKEKISVGDIPIKSQVELDFKKDNSNIKKLLTEIKNVLKRLEENISDEN